MKEIDDAREVLHRRQLPLFGNRYAGIEEREYRNRRPIFPALGRPGDEYQTPSHPQNPMGDSMGPGG